MARIKIFLLAFCCDANVWQAKLVPNLSNTTFTVCIAFYNMFAIILSQFDICDVFDCFPLRFH